MESVIAYTDRRWKSLEERPPRPRTRVVLETRGRHVSLSYRQLSVD